MPLNKNQKVAFVGPLVSDEYNIIGSWAASGDRNGFAVSVQEGIAKIADKSKVTFDKGVEIVDTKRNMMQKALDNAAKADVIVAAADDKVNSVPLAVRLVHFTFLFNFTVIFVPSQSAFALPRWGTLGSVITAVPPPNERSYPLCPSVK